MFNINIIYFIKHILYNWTEDNLQQAHDQRTCNTQVNWQYQYFHWHYSGL